MKRGFIFIVFILLISPVLAKEIIVPESFPVEKDTFEKEVYFYAGSKLIASSKEGLSYKYNDRLGSDFESKSLPFGQPILTDNRFSFTGKELDSDLYYFGARYHDPEIGRFISVDPVSSEPPYQYVGNNPLNYIDPTGTEMNMFSNVGHMIAGEIFPKMMEIYELAESQKNFVNSYYEKEGNFNHFFIVDKETTSLFLVDLERNSIEFMGQVGIGRNRGDRDVSGGRETGKGSYQTQAGWVRINRVSAEFSEGTKSHENYGDQFYGFDAWVENTWKEVPTGIHGTEHETEGWVSGGCTRLCEPLEDNLRENYLDRGVLFYYTSDEGSTTSG